MPTIFSASTRATRRKCRYSFRDIIGAVRRRECDQEDENETCDKHRYRNYGVVTAPPQLDPAPAVHPKQCEPVMMRLCANFSGLKSAIVCGNSGATPSSSIWLKSQ